MDEVIDPFPPAEFRCVCTFTHSYGRDPARCHNRATREDGRCDSCRGVHAQIAHAMHHVIRNYATAH